MVDRGLLDMTVGQLMDESRQKICESDEEYRRREDELAEAEDRYLELNLPDDVKEIVDDYIARLQSSNSRYADISYVAGIEDAVGMLKKLGLVKGE